MTTYTVDGRPFLTTLDAQTIRTLWRRAAGMSAAADTRAMFFRSMVRRWEKGERF